MATNPFDILEERLNRIEASIEKLSINQVPNILPREQYLTTDQVCRLLSVSRPTLWSWDKKEILHPIRIGNAKRYRLSEIEAIQNDM